MQRYSKFNPAEYKNAEFLLRTYLACRLHTSIRNPRSMREASHACSLLSPMVSVNSFRRLDAAPEVLHNKILSDESRKTRTRRSSPIAVCGSFMSRRSPAESEEYAVNNQNPYTMGLLVFQEVSSYDH